MSDTPHQTMPRSDRRLAALQRDAALARVTRARRWVITATAALTAGIAALVSAVAPGRSQGATHLRSSVVAASSSAPALPLPLAAGPGALGLQGPAQAPGAPAPQMAAPAPAPAPPGAGGGAVSGGS
ncbi:MAG: hypothetical protein M3025_08700 [Actinomycetota bacterium]|nr:hypothetical protein [Actinomycetota bacterium]